MMTMAHHDVRIRRLCINALLPLVLLMPVTGPYKSFGLSYYSVTIKITIAYESNE